MHSFKEAKSASFCKGFFFYKVDSLWCHRGFDFLVWSSSGSCASTRAGASGVVLKADIYDGATTVGHIFHPVDLLVLTNHFALVSEMSPKKYVFGGERKLADLIFPRRPWSDCTFFSHNTSQELIYKQGPVCCWICGTETSTCKHFLEGFEVLRSFTGNVKKVIPKKVILGLCGSKPVTGAFWSYGGSKAAPEEPRWAHDDRFKCTWTREAWRGLLDEL